MGAYTLTEPELAAPASPNTSSRRMTLNMGPQHPSTHGVLRLELELEGEVIQSAKPDIGYLHTGIEKEFEVKTYQQAVTLTDRIDYLAPLSNNLCYSLAVEKLLGLEIPAMAQWTRVMLVELTRLNSHLVWLGTHALDLGAMSMAEAVRRLTSHPAAVLGLQQRGTIREGFAGDLLLFDPQTVGRGPKRRVHDLPAGAARLTTDALGVHGVWVNGMQVADADGMLRDTPRVGEILTEFAT